jgi:hypothetical protein
MSRQGILHPLPVFMYLLLKKRFPFPAAMSQRTGQIPPDA